MRTKFIRGLRRRFLLRFHMSHQATGRMAPPFSKLLLHLSVLEPLVHCPLTARLSYLLFFLFLKLWLWDIWTTTRQTGGKTGMLGD